MLNSQADQIKLNMTLRPVKKGRHQAALDCLHYSGSGILPPAFDEVAAVHFPATANLIPNADV